MPRRVLRQHLAHQEDLVPPASNRFAHKRFRSAIAVHFRRVDQRYPEIDPKLDCLDLAGVPTWLFGEMLRAMAQHGITSPDGSFCRANGSRAGFGRYPASVLTSRFHAVKAGPPRCSAGFEACLRASAKSLTTSRLNAGMWTATADL
jgi:hypothetical protein